MAMIPAVKDNNGRLFFKPKEINTIFSNFYKDLYSLELSILESDIKKFLLSLNLPRVTVDQLTYLDAPITVEEIVGVIKHLPSDKAPGLDGYTAEFYKSFPEDIAPLLLNTYNESFQEGRSHLHYLKPLLHLS